MKITLASREWEKTVKGDFEGLYGRLPGDLQKLVRKIMDSPTYDFGAMELLDYLDIEWRE